MTGAANAATNQPPVPVRDKKSLNSSKRPCDAEKNDCVICQFGFICLTHLPKKDNVAQENSKASKSEKPQTVTINTENVPMKRNRKRKLDEEEEIPSSERVFNLFGSELLSLQVQVPIDSNKDYVCVICDLGFRCLTHVPVEHTVNQENDASAVTEEAPIQNVIVTDENNTSLFEAITENFSKLPLSTEETSTTLLQGHEAVEKSFEVNVPVKVKPSQVEVVTDRKKSNEQTPIQEKISVMPTIELEMNEASLVTGNENEMPLAKIGLTQDELMSSEATLENTSQHVEIYFNETSTQLLPLDSNANSLMVSKSFDNQMKKPDLPQALKVLNTSCPSPFNECIPKRGRGRPRKIVLNSTPVVIHPVQQPMVVVPISNLNDDPPILVNQLTVEVPRNRNVMNIEMPNLEPAIPIPKP